MASIKISQLNLSTAYTLNDVVAIVDSGSTETKKIKINTLLRNGDNIFEGGGITSIALGTDGDSPSFEVLRNGTLTSAVIGSHGSFIDNTGNSFIGGSFNCEIQSGAAGQVGILGSDGVVINGGYNNAIIASYSGPSINGGEENFIAASVGGSQIQGGNNNAVIASQGFVLGGNSNKCVGAGVEAGGWNGPRYSFAGGGYNLTTTSDNGNQHAALAYNGLTFDGSISSMGSGFLYHCAGMAIESGTIKHNTTALIASSGATTLYDRTLHTDNLYSYGRIQTNTTISSTIANVQTLQGNSGGWTQMTDISSGNLNLQIDDVRNGEVYFWVIDNTSGGSVSVNSTATNTGFTITDNTSATMGTGKHILTIVIVNDNIIIEGTH